MATEPRVVTPALLRSLPLPRPGEEKAANGRLLVLGGSTRSPGAVRLAAEAALRVGAGKVAIATVEPVLAGLAPLVPEAALVPLGTDAEGAIDLREADRVAAETGRADVLLAGPGLVDPDHAAGFLERVLAAADTTVALDGLASAFVSAHPEGLHRFEGRAVLTVNPDELAQTAGVGEDDVLRDPVRVAGRVAERSRVVVVCAGTVKHIVAPGGDGWVVEGGGRGLAASGSGDVHAGIVGGLLARGVEPVRAAVWAAYVHARCGERLAAAVGTVGYLARELPAEVPRVLAELA